MFWDAACGDAEQSAAIGGEPDSPLSALLANLGRGVRHASPHIRVRSFDQRPERAGVDTTIRTEFHVAHELASAFQERVRIGKLCSAKEADIDVSLEGIDIAEGRITDAGGGMPIMHEFAHVISAGPHDVEPALRDRAQGAGVAAHPRVYGRISFKR